MMCQTRVPLHNFGQSLAKVLVKINIKRLLFFCGTFIMISPSGGSVEEYRKLSEGQALHILGKVISAVEFMHSQRLLHRDIKGQLA